MSDLIDYKKRIYQWCSIPLAYDESGKYPVTDRVVDCYLAETILGWKWYSLGKEHKDFSGKPFTKILSHSIPDKRYILEANSHVPNFCSGEDVFKLVTKLGISSIPITDTTKFKDIVDYILSKVEGLK